MVSYEFYIEQYGGDLITISEWNTYARQAEAKLNRYKKMYTVRPNSINSEEMAMCAMAEAMHNFDVLANGEGGVQSASIGSVSASFAAPKVDISAPAQEAELYKCATLYLCIYRGIGV